MGFFKDSQVLSNSPTSLVPLCGKCGLYKLCNSPKMPVSGDGRKKILLVAEAPGKDEDREGVQLVGKSGQHVERVLKQIGINMRKDCWLTNTLICRPPNNETPSDKQIAYCRPNLIKTINTLHPEVIILLGGPSVKSLMQWVWPGNRIEGISRWVGWQIPSQKLNTWICPVYHPSYVMREKNKALDKLFKEYLKEAVNKTGRPWETVPDYKKDIKVIYKAKQAAKYICEINRRGGIIAFDYETNMLAPDSDNARIVSCSICWKGKVTIAFPWHGVVIDAMRELLRGKSTWKIASNYKFEERHTIKEFGHGVRNWLWDTMLGAHWLDSRKHITGLKFQSLVLLGQESYAEHIAPYLDVDGKNKENNIKEVNLHDLLIYNGLDSLLEYKVAFIQMRTGKYDWREKVRAA